MATFEGRTASSGPGVRAENADAVRAVLARYRLRCEGVEVGLAPEEKSRDGQRVPTGRYRLYFHGYDTPDVWRPEEGRDPEGEGFDWDEDGTADCLEELMLAVAPYLEGPWVIQCVGAEKCRFPMVASEWRVEPGGTEVQYNGFKGKSPRGAMKRDPVSVQ